MDFADFTQRKVKSILNEIENLKTSDFPHVDSKTALEYLEDLFKNDLIRLELSAAFLNDAIKLGECSRANAHIFRFHPILGFILRSTNVRNSFEFFDPVLRLAKKLIGSDARLVLSSEWRFSPFTYPLVFSELPNFVLIGLPASESANALVIPLAGHELGHSVWRRSGLGTSLDKVIENCIVNCYANNWAELKRLFQIQQKETQIKDDMFLRSIWTPSYKLSKRQCEEIFCDMLGTRIFGESYVHSFHYLIAPNLGGKRSELYPDLKDRAKFIVRAAKKYNVDVDTNFEKFFRDNPKNYDPQNSFQLRMSDLATEMVVDRLIDEAQKIVDEAGIPVPSCKEAERAFDCFKEGVPAGNTHCLADIINAGWKAYLSARIWADQNWDTGREFRSLNALIFKTIEVMEFTERTR